MKPHLLLGAIFLGALCLMPRPALADPAKATIKHAEIVEYVFAPQPAAPQATGVGYAMQAAYPVSAVQTAPWQYGSPYDPYGPLSTNPFPFGVPYYSNYPGYGYYPYGYGYGFSSFGFGSPFFFSQRSFHSRR